jgi:hypothetical protein
MSAKEKAKILVQEYLALEAEMKNLKAQQKACAENLSKLYRECNVYSSSIFQEGPEPEIREANLVKIADRWVCFKFDTESGEMSELYYSGINVVE